MKHSGSTRGARWVEAMESRLLLAGDVIVSASAGDLVIRGDVEDNQVLITQPDTNTVRIAGLDETTVNGQEFVDLPGLSDDLLIRMRQGGEDHVEIQGGLLVPDALHARLGAGELLIEGSFAPVEIGGDLSVRTGEDGHVTLRNEVETGGATSIDSGGDVSVVGGLATLPDFAAAEFDNSLNINNPYFPLVPGAKYTYLAEAVDEDTGETATEDIIVEVLPEARTILGVQVRVVRDSVFADGRIIEDTFDWYAQDNNGNVWYFGENVTNFEYDDEGNVTTNNDGSWTAGEDGALPGVIMEAEPRAGHSYYQEFAPGNVLDQAKGLATDESVTVPVGTYDNVFRSEESSVIEPFSLANKLYAPGVGTMVEFDFDISNGEILQTTRLVALELDGQDVTQIVPGDFDGVNATGRFIGGPSSAEKAAFKSSGPVALRGATYEGALSVRTPEAVIVVDSVLEGNVLIRTPDVLSLREVSAGRIITLAGNADGAFIFNSDINRFRASFGGGDDTLRVQDSEFGTLTADGGRGENTFVEEGKNVFGRLRLKRFIEE